MPKHLRSRVAGPPPSDALDDRSQHLHKRYVLEINGDVVARKTEFLTDEQLLSLRNELDLRNEAGQEHAREIELYVKQRRE